MQQQIEFTSLARVGLFKALLLFALSLSATGSMRAVAEDGDLAQTCSDVHFSHKGCNQIRESHQGRSGRRDSKGWRRAARLVQCHALELSKDTRSLNGAAR